MEVLINWSDPTFYGQFWLLIVRTGVTALKGPKRTGTENGEPQLLEGQMSCRMRKLRDLFTVMRDFHNQNGEIVSFVSRVGTWMI